MLPAAVAAAFVGALLGPALAPGHLLRYDLVQVPDPALGPDALGLGDRLPRAVPWDGFVVGLSAVVGDGFAVQVVAAAALLLAATGVARLTPGGTGARATAAAVAVWNPFVVEQLAIGHVPHLVSYGVLPWLVAGTAGVVRHGPTRLPGTAALAALGSVTPGGGVLCVLVVAATVLAVADRTAVPSAGAVRRWWGPAAVATTVLAQAPWVVAGALHPVGGRVDPSGAALFAVRAETRAGPLVDALGLGGLWNADAVPASRATPLALASTVLLVGLAAVGATTVTGRRARVPRRAAVVAALLVAATWLVAVLGALPGGRGVLAALVETVPGAGLLRDGHRWLAVPALGLAVLAGLGVERLAARAAAGATGPVRRARRAAVHLTAVALLVAVLPDAAWGLSGRLRPAQLPAGWQVAARAVDAAADTSRVLVLPWQPFRRFAWAGGAPVLDPVPRMLDRPVLVSDRLPVDGRLLAAEGPAATAADAALADGRLDPAEARRLAIGWILVERGTPGRLPALPPGRTVVDTPDVLLVALDPAPSAPGPGALRSVTVLAAHAVWALLLVLGGAVAVTLRIRNRIRVAERLP